MTDAPAPVRKPGDSVPPHAVRNQGIPQHVVIVGASISALGAALAFGRVGVRVTCIERDAGEMPKDHLDAALKWDRRGASQTRHSHVLLAPLLNLIKEHEPELRARLHAAGAEELSFKDLARASFPDPELVPGDDAIGFIACRRVVFEYLVRQYVVERYGTRIVEGATVTGLEVAPGDLPAVTALNVRHRNGGDERFAGDLFVDASGRHTQLDKWLEAAGIQPPRQESHPCGIFYTSRFYRLKDDAEYPAMDGRRALSGAAQGVDLGYLKVGIFRADNRTFSLTLAADPEDAPLRAVAHEREFDIAASHIDATRPWVDPARASPISKVFLYGNLTNTRRFFVENGRPLVAGLFAIGDALIHTNPIAGRGCALGWVTAFRLAGIVTREEDPVARALAYDAAVEADVVPWYRSQVQQDYQAIAINKALQRGEDPFVFERPDGSIDEERQRLVVFRKGFAVAARKDLDLLRTLFRQVCLLDLPDALLKRTDLIPKVLAGYEEGRNVDLKLRPERDEMLALFAAPTHAAD